MSVCLVVVELRFSLFLRISSINSLFFVKLKRTLFVDREWFVMLFIRFLNDRLRVGLTSEHAMILSEFGTSFMRFKQISTKFGKLSSQESIVV
jgi:hypothetical protein